MYAAAFFRLLQWHNALFIRVLSNAMFMSTIQYALFARLLGKMMKCKRTSQRVPRREEVLYLAHYDFQARALGPSGAWTYMS